ncbi:uncharacterized protein LOC132641033 isoform X3 [Lycium barbarum]|nr:uncharacterized protein LOC132641033 isoform X3 [Lycium barbarum]XP_060213874.1 uncharacterized protein LOC132641033 isoform X3 [Lycium barbarum]XP_060213875.1 uncharacterized protein LOC132641033 isoform X3 [Lycium barbarum]
MIVLKGSVPISFGGTEQPAAYAELVSIGGLNADVNKKFSAAIAETLETKLSIPKSQFFRKFYDAKANQSQEYAQCLHALHQYYIMSCNKFTSHQQIYRKIVLHQSITQKDCMDRDNLVRRRTEVFHISQGIRNIVAAQGAEGIIWNVKLNVQRAYLVWNGGNRTQSIILTSSKCDSQIISNSYTRNHSIAHINIAYLQMDRC